MTSDQIGGLIGLAVFLVLPMLIGLLLLVKARSLARARLRFLAGASHSNLEPGQTAVRVYRFLGLFFLIAPLLVFLFGILAAMHQS
jgi:hypothetical protein